MCQQNLVHNCPWAQFAQYTTRHMWPWWRHDTTFSMELSQANRHNNRFRLSEGEKELGIKTIERRRLTGSLSLSLDISFGLEKKSLHYSCLCKQRAGIQFKFLSLRIDAKTKQKLFSCDTESAPACRKKDNLNIVVTLNLLSEKFTFSLFFFVIIKINPPERNLNFILKRFLIFYVHKRKTILVPSHSFHFVHSKNPILKFHFPFTSSSFIHPQQ